MFTSRLVTVVGATLAALVIAAASATAASKVTSAMIKDGTITAKDIKKGAITNAQLAAAVRKDIANAYDVTAWIKVDIKTDLSPTVSNITWSSLGKMPTASRTAVGTYVITVPNMDKYSQFGFIAAPTLTTTSTTPYVLTPQIDSNRVTIYAQAAGALADVPAGSSLNIALM
jgi:hypothetical protein